MDKKNAIQRDGFGSNQWSAANKLIRGGGTLSEFQATEPSYKVDYEKAMLELARKSRKSSSS